eukprot:SAG11_NODE_1997_length_3945_cov_56.897556_2_plen_40_part_00
MELSIGKSINLSFTGASMHNLLKELYYFSTVEHFVLPLL